MASPFRETRKRQCVSHQPSCAGAIAENFSTSALPNLRRPTHSMAEATRDDPATGICNTTLPSGRARKCGGTRSGTDVEDACAGRRQARNEPLRRIVRLIEQPGKLRDALAIRHSTVLQNFSRAVVAGDARHATARVRP
jgi:hypothetical protein